MPPLHRRIRGSAGAQLHPGELIDRMTEAYPGLANPYTLWVAAYDQLGP